MATSVSLFDQGLVQIFQAAVAGLAAKRPYVIGLAGVADGAGAIQPLAAFTTNAAGAAIVNATGPIRQLIRGPGAAERKYLVIAEGAPGRIGVVVQVEQFSPPR